MVFNAPFIKHSSEIALRKNINRVLGSIIPGVFNGTVPNEYGYPAILIGESTTGTEFVTKGNEGEELIITIHIYTEEEGYDKLDDLTEEVLVALSSIPQQLDEHWYVVKYNIEPGSRKWHYAADKAQKILYVRFSCDYT